MSGRKRVSAPAGGDTAGVTEAVAPAVAVPAEESAPLETATEATIADSEAAPGGITIEPEETVEVIGEPVTDEEAAELPEAVLEYAEFVVVACAVLRTHGGDEVYRYGGSIITGEQFTAESIEHALSVGAVALSE